MTAVFTRCLAGAAAALAIPLPLAIGAPLASATERWRAPVDGRVSRAFALGANPFAPGAHRGADFAPPSGATVHAACSGRVLVAGRVGTSGRLVTIRCGRWRATHMPLATIAVRAGATVRRGTAIGTVAASTAHAGLHLGARREGSRFGYTDPLRLIGPDPRTTPPTATRPPPHRPRRHPVPARASATHPVQAPLARSAWAPPAPGARGSLLAPWPAWAGLAALLAGAVGSGVRLRVRVRLARTPRAAGQESP